MQVFKNLYQYRELLKSNVKKEIRGKYKGSFLGILWSFINPLLLVLVYALVFPYIMKSQEENYLIFLIVAIIPWNFFTTVLTQGSNCVWLNGGIIKKVYFPREILPISVVIAGLINFFISCIIILAFLIFSGVGITMNIFWVFPIAIIQAIFSLGLLFILSAINVYVRDIEYIVSFIINLLFYGTPILYNANQFEGSIIAQVIKLNPMTSLIESYRNIFYYQSRPQMSALLYIFIIAMFLLIVGYFIFRKLEKGFAEEV